MIRQRVTRHGVIFPLAPPAQLPGCSIDRDLVGVPKQGPVKKWLDQRKQWDHKFATAKRKVHKRFIDDLAIGYEGFGEGEFPPPSALAGRRRKEGTTKPTKRSKSMGLALWSLWGSKHDKMTMNREAEAGKNDQDVEMAAATGAEGEGSRSFADIERQREQSPTSPRGADGRSRSRRRKVTYERQDENENGSSEVLGEIESTGQQQQLSGLLSPGYQPQQQQQQHDPEVGIGTTGKRPYVDGIAVPFSIKKEAETASMMTLTSNTSLGLASPRASTSRPMSPAGEEQHGRSGLSNAGGGVGLPTNGEEDGGNKTSGSIIPNNADSYHEEGEVDKGKGKEAVAAAEAEAEATPAAERPGLETFVTAAEALPTVKGTGAGPS